MPTSFDEMNNAEEAPSDPLPLFLDWLAEAETKESVDPSAMFLATVSPDGIPEGRVVLLKGVDDRGFVFYTNTTSAKGKALNDNPKAALCFYWKSLGKQIRISGQTQPVSDIEADAYYNTRPRGSRIGAWASRQSQTLEDKAALIRQMEEYEEKFWEGDIPRPPFWSGYRLEPSRYEFWQEGKFRLHTRLLYKKSDKGWDRSLLYP